VIGAGHRSAAIEGSFRFWGGHSLGDRRDLVQAVPLAGVLRQIQNGPGGHDVHRLEVAEAGQDVRPVPTVDSGDFVRLNKFMGVRRGWVKELDGPVGGSPGCCRNCPPPARSYTGYVLEPSLQIPGIRWLRNGKPFRASRVVGTSGDQGLSATVRLCGIGKKMRARMSTLAASPCRRFTTRLRIAEAEYRKWLSGCVVMTDRISASCVRNTDHSVLCAQFLPRTFRPCALLRTGERRRWSVVLHASSAVCLLSAMAASIGKPSSKQGHARYRLPVPHSTSR